MSQQQRASQQAASQVAAPPVQAGAMPAAADEEKALLSEGLFLAVCDFECCLNIPIIGLSCHVVLLLSSHVSREEIWQEGVPSEFD